jgi:ferrous iron transport protein B
MEQQKDSYLGRLGQLCEPVVKPLGLNWKVCISLLSGAAAKELIISILGVLYSETDVEDGSTTLPQKLTAPNPQTGEPDFTMRNSLAFLVFILLYFPCVASLAAIARETGTWKWSVFSVFYNTTLAWVVAYAVYMIAGIWL